MASLSFGYMAAYGSYVLFMVRRYMAAYGSYVVLMSYGTYGFADYGTYVRCFPGFLTLFGSP